MRPSGTACALSPDTSDTRAPWPAGLSVTVAGVGDGLKMRATSAAPPSATRNDDSVTGSPARLNGACVWGAAGSTANTSNG